MPKKISILFDAYHLYHLPQFDPVIDLLAQDNRFELFLSTSNNIAEKERALSLSILDKRPGTVIKAETEQARSGMIKKLGKEIAQLLILGGKQKREGL